MISLWLLSYLHHLFHDALITTNDMRGIISLHIIHSPVLYSTTDGLYKGLLRSSFNHTSYECFIFTNIILCLLSIVTMIFVHYSPSYFIPRSIVKCNITKLN